MNVLYDSNTRPSQLNLTVSSFIAIDSLAIHNAPYAGGGIVSKSEPNDTVYIRTTVSDPLGTADITDVDLGIIDIGCSTVRTTLDDGDLVASTASTKTYGSNGTLARAQGEYLVTVAANEGTEGVSARKALPHEVVTGSSISNRVWLDKQGRHTGCR